MDLDTLFNSSWWAKALIDHRNHDAMVHTGDRAHQKRDPDAHEQHGADHELTPWEKTWIAERVKDVVLEKCTKGDEAVKLLAEPHEEHEARELQTRALDYFGASHEETRRKLEARRAAHKKEHDEAHHLEHRKERDGKFEKLDHATVAAIREQISQAMTQIDGHLAPKHGLIDRHIATVKAEVADVRRQAEEHRATAELVVSKQYDEHVEHFTAQVQREIRMLATGRPPEEPALEVAPASEDPEKMLAEIDAAYAPYLETDAPPAPDAIDAEFDEPEAVATEDDVTDRSEEE